MRRAISGRSPRRVLPKRLQQVLEAAVRGESSKQTADRLHLSVRTVEAYRERARQRLGADKTIIAYWLARNGGLLARTSKRKKQPELGLNSLKKA